MHYPEVPTLQGKRERAEPSDEGLALAVGNAGGCNEVPARCIVISIGRLEPTIAFFRLSADQVQFVVAQDTLGAARLDHLSDALDDGRAVDPAVNEIADKHKPISLWMAAGRVVAQPDQQAFKCRHLPMDVADNINRAVKQLLYEFHGLGWLR